jgi:phage gp16-like protein
MKPLKDQIRSQLIKLIHIGKRQLELDDDDYRALLTGSVGKSSCSDMNVHQLDQVLSRMKLMGFKPRSTKNKSPKSSQKKYNTQVDKIRALWIDMHKSGIVEDGGEAALNLWIMRITSKRNGGAGVSKVQWLEAESTLATVALESLKQWYKRVMADWQNEDLKRVSIEQQRADKPQADVVEQLLEDQAIFYWPIFTGLGISKSKDYCTNRLELRAGS